MPDEAKTELLRSLGRVVRGLAALFWGLPLTLVVYVQTARTDWLDFFRFMALLPAMIVSGVVYFSFLQLRHFQKQERVWQRSLDWAEVFAIINIGLSPFLFWWRRFPFDPHYAACVMALMLCSVLLLIQTNRVLLRLSAMLPDEMLRGETRMFTRFNMLILTAIFSLLVLYFASLQLRAVPFSLSNILALIHADGIWILLFLLLTPVAMTMTLIWKIKEVIFNGIFSADR